jgi:hypothetical protein
LQKRKEDARHSQKAGREDPGDRHGKKPRDPGILAAKEVRRQGTGQRKERKPPHKRASSAGWHFLNSYQSCPRKFYFRYLRGFTPEHTAPVLTFGGAFHDGKATFYRTGSRKKAIQAAQDYIEEAAPEYEDSYLPEIEYIRVENLMEAWISRCGRDDLRYYKILAVEEEMEAALYNGFRLTGRADAVLQSKSTGDRFLLETKTTGYSIEVTYRGLTNSDQISCYLWLLKKTHPNWKVDTCLPDIAYSRQSRVEVLREALITRSPQRLQEFEDQTVGLLTEISQKVQSIGSYPLLMLFPRNAAPGWCTSFNRACEYMEICDQDCPVGEVPEGFKIDDWVDYKKILTLKEVKWQGFASRMRSEESYRKRLSASQKTGRGRSGSTSKTPRQASSSALKKTKEKTSGPYSTRLRFPKTRVRKTSLSGPRSLLPKGQA